jgi:N-acetylmuramoyl-L-alanine amidase-like protein
VAAMTAALQRYGLTVEVAAGAATRGDTVFNPKVFVGHHTAGPRTGDRPSLAICVNGRPDLDGPLCQWFMARSGRIVIVATGRANHAGKGGWRGVTGNSGAMGMEAEDDGDGTWTVAQKWAWPRAVAAGLDLMGQGPEWYCAHREWAPTRKVDPTGIASEWVRDGVDLVRTHHADTTTGGMSMAEINDVMTALAEIKTELGIVRRGDKAPGGNEGNDPGDTHARNLTRLSQRVEGLETSMTAVRADVAAILRAVTAPPAG